MCVVLPFDPPFLELAIGTKEPAFERIVIAEISLDLGLGQVDPQPCFTGSLAIEPWFLQTEALQALQSLGDRRTIVDVDLSAFSNSDQVGCLVLDLGVLSEGQHHRCPRLLPKAHRRLLGELEFDVAHGLSIFNVGLQVRLPILVELERPEDDLFGPKSVLESVFVRFRLAFGGLGPRGPLRISCVCVNLGRRCHGIGLDCGTSWSFIRRKFAYYFNSKA